MLRPTAVKVYPEKDYMLKVEFDNGEIKRFDVKPYIQGEWYGQLADEAYNAALAEKGLLLRASERIHNAIHQNADEALKLKMERLDLRIRMPRGRMPGMCRRRTQMPRRYDP